MAARPTLRQLAYLAAVVETRHFGRAAEACHVTQSTLSAGLKELEELLGVELVERDRRRVLPTPLGEATAARARDILARTDGLVEAARAGGVPLSGPLRIGVIPTIAPFLLPRLVPLLRRRHPDLQPWLREDQSAPLVAELAAGRLDVLVLALPYPLDGQDSRRVAEDPFHVALPPGHRLAGHETLTPAELPGDELLLLEEGHCLREHAMAACHLAPAPQARAMAATSLPTLVQMVAAGLGVTLLPAMALESDLLRGTGIATVSLASDVPARGIGLAWRPASGRVEDYGRLGAAVREVLGGCTA